MQLSWNLINGGWSFSLFNWCWHWKNLVIYRIYTNNDSMNIAKLKSIIVIILVGKRIEALPRQPKELIHQLNRICINNTAEHLYAYCDFFLRKR